MSAIAPPRGTARPPRARQRPGHDRALTVLLLGFLLLTSASCFRGDEGATATSEAQSGAVTAPVGKTAKLGSGSVLVLTLAPTPRPALPDVVLSPGGYPVPAKGEVYYQARVRVANGGKKAVRVDPWDFVLVIGGSSRSMDSGASGPPARTLLPGTSLSLTLTFRGPAGEPPELLYEPEWFPGSLRVTGERAPAGQAPAGGMGG